MLYSQVKFLSTTFDNTFNLTKHKILECCNRKFHCVRISVNKMRGSVPPTIIRTISKTSHSKYVKDYRDKEYNSTRKQTKSFVGGINFFFVLDVCLAKANGQIKQVADRNDVRKL